MDPQTSRNMDLLKQKFPEVFATVAEVPVPPSHQLVRTPAGVPTLRVTTSTGREIHMHSAHDPLVEAERIAAALPGDHRLLVVLGCGLFYHVLAALDTLLAEEPVLLVEADPVVLRVALSCTALEGLLERPTTALWVGVAPETVGASLARHYPDETLAKLVVLRHLPASELAPDYYRAVHHEVVRRREHADCRVQDPALAAFMDAHFRAGGVRLDAVLSRVACSGAALREARNVLLLMDALRRDRD